MPTITLQPSGQTFEAAAGEPVLDAALRAGISLPYGCRNGACRSCAAHVVSGQVHYPNGIPKALDRLERDAGNALLCAATATGELVVQVDGLDGDGFSPVRTLLCRVMAKTLLAHDVAGLELALPAGERLAFRAGQYVDIALRDGRRRAFSLANPPHRDERLELHVRRVPGGSFSGHVVDGLRERSLLRIVGPLGSFWLRKAQERPVILMAGGTGFAPVKSIIEDALHTGFDQPMTLYRGVRAVRDLYLDELVQGWAREHPRLHYVPVLSAPGPDDAWGGRTGLVHEAVLADHADLSSHAIYMSGPPAMVNAARSAFALRGVDLAYMHADAFEHAWETGHDG